MKHSVLQCFVVLLLFVHYIRSSTQTPSAESEKINGTTNCTAIAGADSGCDATANGSHLKTPAENIANENVKNYAYGDQDKSALGYRGLSKNESKSAVDDTDAEFDKYLEKYLEENPTATVVKSQPNLQIENEVLRLTVNGGSGVDVAVHLVDIDPFKDYLIIKGGFSTPESKGRKIVGPITQEKPVKFKLFDTNELYIRFSFTNDKTQKSYKGFVLTYKPFGEVTVSTVQPSENVTVPLDKLETISILLKVAKVNQTMETWTKFKELFVLSANKFIKENKIAVEECTAENVTFVYVSRCPNQWPNAQNCLKLKLAISLKPESELEATRNQDPAIIIDEYDETKPSNEPKYELSTDHLRQMWLAHGKALFAQNGYKEFVLPDPSAVLLLWTSISLGVLIIFLLVLFTIWKLEFFQDYRRMSWKSTDDQQRIFKSQPEIDISMFPSPHQIVPSLFPGDINTGYAGATNHTSALPFEYVSQPISFNESDFKRRSSSAPVDHDREGVEVPFQPDIIDFNEPQGHQKVFFPEDDIEFSNSSSTSSSGRPKRGDNGYHQDAIA